MPTATRGSRRASPISRSPTRSARTASSMRPTRPRSSPAPSAATSAMNSGGAHCLKYGVTTNNLLGVRLVTFDGEIVDIGGPALDAAGLDWLGLICGSEGQLGIVTEATVRLIRAGRGRAAGAVRLRLGEDASRCVAAIIGAGIVPVAMEYMDKPAIADQREFRPCRLSARRRGDADRRGRGLRSRDRGRARQHHRHRQGAWRAHDARVDVGDGERADLEGPQIGVRRHRPRRRLYLHGRHGADRAIARGAASASARSAPPTACASPTCSTPATATCIR